MLSFNFLADLAICVQTELHMQERMCQAIIINNKYYNYIPDIAYHDNYFNDENITISILLHILKY